MISAPPDLLDTFRYTAFSVGRVYLIATKYDYFYLRLHIIGEQQIKIKFFSVILIMCNLNFMSSYFDVVSRNCERNEIVMAV